MKSMWKIYESMAIELTLNVEHDKDCFLVKSEVILILSISIFINLKVSSIN